MNVLYTLIVGRGQMSNTFFECPPLLIIGGGGADVFIMLIYHFS